MARRPQRDSFSRLREKGRLRLRQPPSEDLARCHQPERFGRDGSISEEVGSGRFGAGGASSADVSASAATGGAVGVSGTAATGVSAATGAGTA